jgi:hypothetical protein
MISTHATGTYTTKNWDEKSFSEIEGAGKLTRASVVDTFEGDIQGEATLEYLMAYRDDQFASFVGLERVVGRIGDRSGSFALQQHGTFENGVVKATWSVVSDSGTGDLRGLRGEGGYFWDAPQGQSATFTLDYDLA